MKSLVAEVKAEVQEVYIYFFYLFIYFSFFIFLSLLLISFLPPSGPRRIPKRKTISKSVSLFIIYIIYYYLLLFIIIYNLYYLLLFIIIYNLYYLYFFFLFIHIIITPLPLPLLSSQLYYNSRTPQTRPKKPQ